MIQEHYDDQDIIKLNIRPETKRWDVELQFIRKEIEFFKGLLKSSVTEASGASPEDIASQLEKLSAMQKENSRRLQGLTDFKNKMEGLDECDDVQCEIFYIKDHLLQKEILQQHFRDFRQLKENIFEVFGSFATDPQNAE